MEKRRRHAPNSENLPGPWVNDSVQYTIVEVEQRAHWRTRLATNGSHEWEDIVLVSKISGYTRVSSARKKLVASLKSCKRASSVRERLDISMERTCASQEGSSEGRRKISRRSFHGAKVNVVSHGEKREGCYERRNQGKRHCGECWAVAEEESWNQVKEQAHTINQRGWKKPEREVKREERGGS